VADRLRTCDRSTDTVARLGGDEFAVLLTDVDTVDDLKGQAERVVRMIDEQFDLNGEVVTIGASVGIAWNDFGEREAGDELLRRADIAMYAAKTAGKGRFRCFEPQMRPVGVDATSGLP
jgi:diguanylate cyclase (GGDEF)-like protein